jgi:hypothetical protein
MLFDAPFIPVSRKIYKDYLMRRHLLFTERELRNNLDDIWRIGKDIKINEIKNINGGVYYLTSYIKKGLRLQWSREFFKKKIIRNDVFYLVKYNKLTKKVYIDNIFDAPFISKMDYKIFKNRIPASIFDRLKMNFFKCRLSDDMNSVKLAMARIKIEQDDYKRYKIERAEFLEFKGKNYLTKKSKL